MSADAPTLLRRLSRLGRRDWVDFLRAHWSLLKAGWALRWRRRGGGVSVRTSTADREEPDEGSVDEERARQLSLAVDRASRWGPLRPRCLVRAVALHRLLASAGLDGAEVRVGVERGPDGFAAHAWVDYGGLVLGDAPDSVAKYSTLEGLDVLPRR